MKPQDIQWQGTGIEPETGEQGVQACMEYA